MSPEETKFEETQYLAWWWLYAIMAGALLIVLAGSLTTPVPVGTLPLVLLLLVVCLLVFLIVLLFRMRTTVSGDRIVVQFGWISLVRFTIPLSEVQSCRPVTYRTLREFGGWAIRIAGIRIVWGGRRPYTIRGDRAAKVVTAKRTILIGSAVPDQLCAAVNSLLPAPAAPR